MMAASRVKGARPPAVRVEPPMLPAARGAAKVCLILLECSPAIASHFAHLPGLIRELSRHVQVAVVVQQGDPGTAVPGAEVTIVQRAGSHARRALELARILWSLRRLGYRTVFVRISVSAAVVAGLLARLARMRVMYWHCGQQWPPTPSGAAARMARWRETMTQAIAFRLCHRLVTGPSVMARYYATRFGVPAGKILVACNDIDLSASTEAMNRWTPSEARESLNIPVECPVVLFIGRVSPLKGGEYLVPLVSRLKEGVPEVLLIVAGDVHRPGFEEEIRRAGVEDHIRLLGPVANPHVARLHRAADVFILPSNGEGFPRTLLEAMAFGTPFVAFAAGGVSEIVGSDLQDWVTDVGDLDGMADRVTRLLRSPRERARQSAFSRLRVPQFDTPRVARELAALLVQEGAS